MTQQRPYRDPVEQSTIFLQDALLQTENLIVVISGSGHFSYVHLQHLNGLRHDELQPCVFTHVDSLKGEAPNDFQLPIHQQQYENCVAHRACFHHSWHAENMY